MLCCFVCNGQYEKEKLSPEDGKDRRELFHHTCVYLLGIPLFKVQTIVTKAYSFEERSPFCPNCTQLSEQIMPIYFEKERLEKQIEKLQVEVIKKLRELEPTALKVNSAARRFRDMVKESDEARRDEIKANLANFKEERGPEKANAIVKINDEAVEQTLRKFTIEADPLNRSRASGGQGPPLGLIEGFPANFAIPRCVLAVTTPPPPVNIKEEYIDIGVEVQLNEVKQEPITALGNEDYSDDGNEYLNAYDDDDCGDEEDNNYSVTVFQDEGEEEKDETIGWFGGSTDEPGGAKKRNLKRKVLPKQKTPAEKKRAKQKPRSKPVAKPARRSSTREGLRQHVIPTISLTDEEGESEMEMDLGESGDSGEESDVSASSGNGTKLAKNTTSRRRNRRTTFGQQLKNDKYIGEVEITEDGKMMFKGVQIIDKGNGFFKCGNCGMLKQSHQRSLSDHSIQGANRFMRRHIIECHMGGYMCSFCPEEKEKRWDKLNAFIKHVKTHTPTIMTCEICQKPYRKNSKAPFKYHVWTHKSEEEKAEAIKAGVKPPVCPSISIEYKKEKMRLQCFQCGKKFFGWKAMKLHEETHLDKTEREKLKVPCTVCGKMYFKQYIQEHHKNVHEKVLLTAFTCEICVPLKRFYGQHLLRNHMQAVHGERRYTCDQCDKKFLQPYTLMKHKRAVHFKERPYKCHICSHSYVGLFTLKRHIQTIHAENKEAKKERSRQSKASASTSQQESRNNAPNIPTSTRNLPVASHSNNSNNSSTNPGSIHDGLPMSMPVGFNPYHDPNYASYHWNL